jgi:Uma2 family endonuclease
MREITAPPGAKDLPCSDGEPMETERHVQQMLLLQQSLRYFLRGRHDVFVGANMFVYYSETQTRKNDFRGPDVFVVLGTDDHERLSWVAWEEDGKLPDVVIELTSPSTEAVDRGRKLDGYALNDALGYDALPPLPNGDVSCSPLGLALGTREGTFNGLTGRFLRWIDPEGQVLATPEEDAGRERQRADDLARRLAELEGRLGSPTG